MKPKYYDHLNGLPYILAALDFISAFNRKILNQTIDYKTFYVIF